MRCRAAASGKKTHGQRRRTASEIMRSWLREVSAWLRLWYEVVASENLPGSPVLPRPPRNDATSFSQRYPPSSFAAPGRCVPPAFTGGSGSRWLRDAGYFLRSRVGGSSRPGFGGIPMTPLFDSTLAGGTLHADGERPYGPRLHSTSPRPGSQCYVFRIS